LFAECDLKFPHGLVNHHVFRDCTGAAIGWTLRLVPEGEAASAGLPLHDERCALSRSPGDVVTGWLTR
jgi:hypothetical protein